MNQYEIVDILDIIIDSIINDTTDTTDISNSVIEKKRKSCEHPWSEFVFAVTILHSEPVDIINDSKELIESGKLKLNHPSDVEKYINDMKLEKEKKKISEFISTLYEKLKVLTEFQKPIECVYISGKTNIHSEIEELNKNLKKRKEVKSDVYVRFVDGEIYGVSIKNDKNATKSNYSVHKLLDSIEGGFNEEMKKYLKQFLTENGIEKLKPTDTKEEKEVKRNNANRLFYNRDNAYWNRIREMILKNNEDVKKRVIQYLYSSKCPYPVYEYDGTSFIHLNMKVPDINQIVFTEYEEYYKTKNGSQRSAAKMFYQLIVYEKKYRVEIRWKGDCFVSPQFEIHSE